MSFVISAPLKNYDYKCNLNHHSSCHKYCHCKTYCLHVHKNNHHTALPSPHTFKQILPELCPCHWCWSRGSIKVFIISWMVMIMTMALPGFHEWSWWWRWYCQDCMSDDYDDNDGQWYYQVLPRFAASQHPRCGRSVPPRISGGQSSLQKVKMIIIIFMMMNKIVIKVMLLMMVGVSY